MFLLTLPLAVVALVLAIKLVPAHVNETVDPVDNLGGILSVVLVAGLVLSINFAPVPGKGALALGLAAIALAALVAFYIRQRRARFPLYDLDVAARRTFWVAACAGIIVFGSLMGAMFIGQQFLQNVLDYSPVEAGASILPAVVVHGDRRAPLGEARGGTRRAVHAAPRLRVLPAWASSPCSCSGRKAPRTGRSGSRTRSSAPASASREHPHRTRSPAPCRSRARAWRRAPPTSSATSAGRSCSRSSARSSPRATRPRSPRTSRAHRTPRTCRQSVENQLTKSFGSAVDTAQQYPQYSKQIIAAAQQSFVDGANWAYTAGIIAIILGAILVWFYFPKVDDEKRMFAEFQEEDSAATAAS